MIVLENKPVLVTGGAGFVGSNLVRRLIREGAKVTVLDDLFTGSLDNLPPSGFEFIEGSVCDAALIDKVVPEHAVIFHMAARNIIVSTKNPREDFESNIGGTLNVLMAARNSKVERILYTSSTSVYGNPRYLPINEDDRLSLLTPYAVSKLGGENYCMAFYESYGLPTTAVRYLERLRTRPGSVEPVLRRGRQVHRGAVRGALAHHPRRRQPDARLHVRGRRGRSHDRRRAFRPRAGRGLQRRHGRRDARERAGRDAHQGDRRERRGDAFRSPRHRQHPPPGREHREDAPRAALGAGSDAREGAAPHGRVAA
ncbi:MAG: NAD-dependent epimerase/dehydratase family protein [Candidatus Eisenbacteria bacterium]|nr:NAD-dependent epimerase/dehydratase family protein [Candidatus Eisenbacteria bacterium]